MNAKGPILDYDDPTREIDSNEAWARLAQPTGSRTLSWLLLIRVFAVALLLILCFALWRIVWLWSRV